MIFFVHLVFPYFAVMMFISAPKGKEPKYVVYEFLCNDNQGPRPPMFYPVFISEWYVKDIFCFVKQEK